MTKKVRVSILNPETKESTLIKVYINPTSEQLKTIEAFKEEFMGQVQVEYKDIKPITIPDGLKIVEFPETKPVYEGEFVYPIFVKNGVQIAWIDVISGSLNISVEQPFSLDIETTDEGRPAAIWIEGGEE